MRSTTVSVSDTIRTYVAIFKEKILALMVWVHTENNYSATEIQKQ
jgi:hypothetical protein